MRTALTDVDHVTLCVSDLEKSIAFYRNVLGAKLRAQWATGCYFELGTLLSGTIGQRNTSQRRQSHCVFHDR